jgi:hypothetical protein
VLAIPRSIPAVLAEELRILASSLGVSEAIDSGNALCYFCETPLGGYEDLFALFPAGSEVGFVDGESACVRAFALHVQRMGGDGL